MVLRGRVVPLTEPHLYTGLEDDEMDLRSPTPLLENTDITVSVLFACNSKIIIRFIMCTVIMCTYPFKAHPALTYNEPLYQSLMRAKGNNYR
jgi:hypothetical protein